MSELTQRLRTIALSHHNDGNSTTAKLLIEAADEIEDYDRSFDLYWRAEQRGCALWREAGEGRELIMPDKAKMTQFLLEEIDRLKAALEMASQAR